MLYIFTGNGKGKTTAALGTAMRAVGEGKRVLMVQFIKGPWKSGEDESAKSLASRFRFAKKLLRWLTGKKYTESDFRLVKMGKGFVGILGDSLPREEHERAAEDALAYAAKEMESGAWDIIILDEVNNALQLQLIAQEKVIAFVKKYQEKIEHLILTGRDAPQELVDMADLVTEMQDLKHPYDRGIKARRGLEY